MHQNLGEYGIFMLVLLLSLSWHESAHAWMADRLGDYTARYMGRVSLNPLVHIDLIGTLLFPTISFFTGAPLLGWAKPTPVNPLHLRDKRYGNLKVAAAGPLSNCLLGLIFIILFKIVVLFVRGGGDAALGRYAEPLFVFFQQAIFLNVALAVFNLIPIPPLDGSHILEAILPYEAAQKFEGFQRWGSLLLIFLVFTPIFGMIFMPVFGLVRAFLQWFI
ncbi:MAG: site-2 protease family protein [Acidobacteriia bacterium]|nr:site-2 protease family protein [Terriglobia bacterium]